MARRILTDAGPATLGFFEDQGSGEDCPPVDHYGDARLPDGHRSRLQIPGNTLALQAAAHLLGMEE
jgi:hypothetical protein